MKSPIFSRVRSESLTLLLLAAGSTALAACSSGETTYRPAPRYVTPPATTYAAPPTYGAPAYTPPTYAPAPTYGSQPTYTGPTYTTPPPAYTPPAAPAPSPGQMACGKGGKCG